MVPIPSFLYAPGCKIYVATQKHGTIDISDDLVEGTLTRRSDGVSTLSFSLQNARRKYDGVFTPNDRISVQMKRLKWVQVFTGYLNSVPLVTAWPRVVDLTASCSLKRLQYWYWDSHAQASQTMIEQALTNAGKDNGVSDGGITNVVLSILKKVVGWPESKVHIAAIPGGWYKVIEKLAQQINTEIDVADQVAQTLFDQLGSASVGSTAAVGPLNGTYGGFNSKEQKTNAVTIYTVGKQAGATSRDVTIAIVAAMQESSLINKKGGDQDSAGLFQMRPSMGWGTYAQVTDPVYASGKFFKELFKVTDRLVLSVGGAAQAVEKSGYPDAYAKHESAATAMVNDMDKGSKVSDLTSKPQGTSTGEALAQLAVNYCVTYPNIRYDMTGITLTQLQKDPPPYLDCSAFVQAMYLRAMGSLYSLPRTAAAQAAWCKSDGKLVSVKTALDTPGALVFKGGSISSIHHVEMSLGDGKSTIGAHYHGAKPHDVGLNPAVDPSYWDYGGFLPRIAYTTGGAGGSVIFGGTGSATPNSPATPTVDLTTGADVPGYNPDDPFDKMFGDNAWLPVSTAETDPYYAMAQALSGPRALLNDQPLLPYLKSLFNSTMRSFCSAPNGDLIAWYPDYYGMWGTAAKMVVESIEVQDFSMTWSDDYMVTHQFVVTSPLGTNTFDPATGSVAASVDQSVLDSLAVFTTGVVSIDFPAVWNALFGMDLSDAEAKKRADWIKKQFGARPDYQQLPGLVGPKAQLFSAIFLFLRQFAYQYDATVPLTFMPELWPGMLLQIPEFNFQAYVTTVTHQFKFGKDGGFSTSVNLAAPARLTGKGTDKLLGLPVAGGN